MSGDWRGDLDKSQAAFYSKVWPAIASLCGGGELVSLEGSPHSTDRDLDILAGIDGYQRLTRRGMRGVAARVQPIEDGKSPWNTFTIRLQRASGAETEYEKRLRAVEDQGGGWLYAHLTVQAYVSKESGEVLTAAVVKTADLILHAKLCRIDHGWRKNGVECCYTNSTSNAQFVVVPWDHLELSGVRLKKFAPPTAQANVDQAALDAFERAWPKGPVLATSAPSDEISPWST